MSREPIFSVVDLRDPDILRKLLVVLNECQNKDVKIIVKETFRFDGSNVANPKEIDWEALRSYPPVVLESLGLSEWECPHGGNSVWLFPVEWYDYIPEGYVVFTIRFVKRSFSKSQLEKDHKLGVLWFGIIRR